LIFLKVRRTQRTGPFGWTQWNTARVYPNVLAGTYAFDVRCMVNAGVLGVNADGTFEPAFPFIPSYVSVLELSAP
jgi:hypothetical protein